jgi:hypothetical protein
MKAPVPPKEKPKTKARPKDKNDSNTTTAYDIHKDEKRVVVFVEIGDNLQKVLDKALSCAYQSDENIGETMSKMGVDIKTMVESVVKMEVHSESSQKNENTNAKTIRINKR